jgi:hypothetical protein
MRAWQCVACVVWIGFLSLGVRFGHAQAMPLPLDLDVQIKPYYSELVYWEGIPLYMRVINRSTRPYAIAEFKWMGNYRGMFDVEIFNAEGQPMPNTGPLNGRRLMIQPEHYVTLAPGQSIEGSFHGVLRKLEGPGRYLMRITYCPQWKRPPVYVREFDLDVIDAESATVESKEISGGRRDRVLPNVTSIVKIRTADGYWLFAKTEDALRRLMQVNKQATFSASALEDVADYPDRVLRVTCRDDDAEYSFPVDEYGTLLPEDFVVQHRARLFDQEQSRLRRLPAQRPAVTE